MVAFVFVLLAGCITTEPADSLKVHETVIPNSSITEIPVIIPVVQPTNTLQKLNDKIPQTENYSEAVEVDYRKYVDWFLLNNNNIRYYTPNEYVCGQYTVDMINASRNAGFKAYFGTVRFSDDTGHALVAFKSTFSGYTSWYFFEPQTNNQMTPQTISQNLQEKMGKKVTEVAVYGYYDDAGDKDPTTWRFAYSLYNKTY